MTRHTIGLAGAIGVESSFESNPIQVASMIATQQGARRCDSFIFGVSGLSAF